MSPSDTAELKRNLRGAGFEIYRSAGDLVHLAERVRDNLIMDSGVAARLIKDGPNILFSVQVNLRAQASHFPGADEEQVWCRAQELAVAFLDSGYSEEGKRAESVMDPSDPTQSLDISYEILLRRSVESVVALHDELRVALGRPRATTDD